MATKPTSILITDRTASDITNRTPKGFNNFSDVQRVQNWINYFIDEVQPSLTKYTWTRDERVDKSKWQTRILDNITELLKSYPDLSFRVPTADKWDYDKQNQIESILLAMSTAEPFVTKSFADDSWETIIDAANKKLGSVYYKVGDGKRELLSNGETALYSIVAFDEFTKNGSDEKANIAIEFRIESKTYQMDNDAREHQDGDWSSCTFRTETVPVILASLPSVLQNAIKEISVITGSRQTIDKLFPYSEDDEDRLLGREYSAPEYWRRNSAKVNTSGSPPYSYALYFTSYKTENIWRKENAGQSKRCPLLFNL